MQHIFQTINTTKITISLLLDITWIYPNLCFLDKFVKVTVGDKECKIVNETCEPKTTCEVPDGSGKATVKVYWTEDSSSSLEQTYTYESEHCVVNSADPDTFNTQKGMRPYHFIPFT